jgi:hypothetical protein
VNLRPLLSVLVVLTAGTVGVLVGVRASPRFGVPARLTNAAFNDRLGTTSEVVLVLMGNSQCGACNDPDVPAAVARLKTMTDSAATRTEMRFSFIGVSLDWNVGNGLEYLARYGGYDEVIVGRNWLNTGVTSWIWRDHPGPPSMPQAVLLLRTIEQGERGITISRDSILARYVGVDELKRATLPHLGALQ